MPPRLPSLHALRAFEAAARLGGFNKAAKELGVSPTAVSHHIRGLEAALGVALFTRRTRKVRLTEAGERLAKVCSTAFENLANAGHQPVGGADFAWRAVRKAARQPRFQFLLIFIFLAHGARVSG